MNDTRTPPPRTPAAERRARFGSGAFELAGLASVIAITFAYALHRFVGIGETPIVLGTLIAASLLGWNQPGMRPAPRRVGRAPSVGPRRDSMTR